MALKRFGFIVLGDSFEQLHRGDEFTMKVVGVKRHIDSVQAAQQMVKDGIQVIELCGAFGPVWVAKIRDNIKDKVPVGGVMYGPESMPSLMKIIS